MSAPASKGVPAPLVDRRRDRSAPAHAVVLPPPYTAFARSRLRWRAGCEVKILYEGGETYPAMLEALAAAKRSISFESYILAADPTGDRFKAVLSERAQAGVTVRVIYDAVGSFGLSGAWVDELRAAGCEVITFNPIAQWRRRFRLSLRDHRKTIVVDDEVAFTGGTNIAEEYASVADGGGGWHDMHCRLTGPIVNDLSRMFRRTWLKCGGTPYRAAPSGEQAPAGKGKTIVRLLENDGRKKRTAMRRAYLHVLKAAKTSVLIENAYFLPDAGLRRALRRAVSRGVRVRVITPGHSDVRLVEFATLYAMRTLVRWGVEMLRWRGPMMHAKTATVDGVWSTIGSYNFDAQSRFNNLEVTVEMLDPQVATSLERVFDRDAANCDPFDRTSWGKLTWWRKALSWFAFRLRRFL